MRTTPLIGRKAWFGPRRFGWGLEPVSVEGWVATASFVAGAAWLARTPPEDRSAVLELGQGAAGDGRGDGGGDGRRYALALGVLYLILLVLKGTSPGGPRARRAFVAARAAAGPGNGNP